MACTRAELLLKITEYLNSTPQESIEPTRLLEIAMRSRNLVCYDLMAKLTAKPTMKRQDIINIINRMLLDITAE